MNGLCSEQFAAEKPDAENRGCLICPKCNTTCRYLQSNSVKNPRRFYYTCPKSDHNFFKWADKVGDHELIKVPLCGGCNAGVCRVKRETSGPDKGRIMFMCRVKEGEGSCGYRVWQDELEKSEVEKAMNEERKHRDEEADLVSPLTDPSDDVLCRELISQSPEILSREMDQFECVEGKSNATSRTPHKRSRQEEGSCSFRVWQDEIEMPEAVEMMSPFQSGILTCNRANVNVADVDEHIKEGDEGPDPVSPFIEPSDDVICRELISRNHEVVSCKRDHFNCVEGNCNTASRRPEKRSRYGDIIASSDPLESTFAAQDIFLNHCGTGKYNKRSFNVEQHHTPVASSYAVQENVLVNPSYASTSTGSFLGAGSYGSMPAKTSLNKVLAPCQMYSKPATHSIVSKSISNVFHKAADCLQEEFLARLETMDAKDHEAMSHEAEAAFAALDLLIFDYEDFKKRVEELIRCASQLVEINQAMPTNDSHQRLVEVCSSERERLNRINCRHAEVIEAETNKMKHIRCLQEEISSTKARLFQLEAEKSCCEAETRSLELELKKISKDKELLEGKFQTASKEVEESQILLERKEAAEAKFNRAKALLRGTNKTAPYLT